MIWSSKRIVVLGFLFGFPATGCGADTKPRVVADPIPDAASDAHVLPPATSKTEAGPARTCAESSRALTDSTCDTLCRAVDAQKCNSSSDGAGCSSLCAMAVERCPRRVAALVDCGGSTPTFSCDASGSLTSPACAAELDCVRACLSEPHDQ